MFEVPEPHDEWLDAFLTVRPPADAPMSWFSTFSAVVRDARQATGRHLDTGEVEKADLAGNLARNGRVPHFPRSDRRLLRA